MLDRHDKRQHHRRSGRLDLTFDSGNATGIFAMTRQQAGVTPSQIMTPIQNLLTSF
jgi:hypothetical protein